MSEIINQAGQPFELSGEPAATPFHFTLTADATGITELNFVKQSEPLFSVLLTTLDFVNDSFDEPFPSLGDFLRELATTADEVESYHAQQSAAVNEEVPAS